jgi:hypothetical protein
MKLFILLLAILSINTVHSQVLAIVPDPIPEELECATEILDHRTLTFKCTYSEKGWWTFTHVHQDGSYTSIIYQVWGKDQEIILDADDYIISVTLQTFDQRVIFTILPVINNIGDNA